MSENSVFSQLSYAPKARRTLVDAARAARVLARRRQVGYSEDSRDVDADSNSLNESQMTHAWLFTGPPGSGRSTAALAFAAALLCENPDEPGCGYCKGCRDALSGSHTDLVHIVPEGYVINVDTIRDTVVDPASMLPTVAPWRVIVIEDADRLNDASSNALLKSVEEPVPTTVIIMCAPSTDPEDFSVTLRSRCRHVYIPTPPNDAVAEILSAGGSGISPEIAALAASASSGHIGRARRLATDETAQRRRAQIINLAEMIYHGDEAFKEVTAIHNAIEKEAKEELARIAEVEIERIRNSMGAGARGKGVQKSLKDTEKAIKDFEKDQKRKEKRFVQDSIDLVLMDMAGIYRDALAKASGAEIPEINPDFDGLSAELAEKNSPEALIKCLDAIMRTREMLKQQVRPITALDAMVGYLRKACNAK